MDSLITQTMSTLGLLGVGVLMFLENVFPPIPSELIMPLAGYAAARGDMSLVGVVVAGTIGSVLGQFPLYYLGRAVGEQRLHDLANRYGKWITVSKRQSKTHNIPRPLIDQTDTPQPVISHLED